MNIYMYTYIHIYDGKLIWIHRNFEVEMRVVCLSLNMIGQCVDIYMYI